MKKQKAPNRARAVCYRTERERLHFLLVLTRDGNRWTFPGGKIKDGEEEIAAAAREVAEEADAYGRIGDEIERDEADDHSLVATFLMHVTSGDLKPPETWRLPTWFDEHQARAVLRTGRTKPDQRKWLRTLARAAKAVRKS